MFSLVGFLPEEPVFPFKFVHAIVTSIFILTLILSQISNAIFVKEHLKIGDYQNCVYTGLQIAGASTTIPIILSMLYYHEKVRDVIVGFQNIFIKCNMCCFTR